MGGSRGGLKYIIFKISDDQKEIVVDETGKDSDYDVFREKLVNKKEKSGKDRPSYAIYDLEFELEGGEGKRYVGSKIGQIGADTDRSKIAFITYINQDSTGVKVRDHGRRGLMKTDNLSLAWYTPVPGKP